MGPRRTQDFPPIPAPKSMIAELPWYANSVARSHCQLSNRRWRLIKVSVLFLRVLLRFRLSALLEMRPDTSDRLGLGACLVFVSRCSLSDSNYAPFLCPGSVGTLLQTRVRDPSRLQSA